MKFNKIALALTGAGLLAALGGCSGGGGGDAGTASGGGSGVVAGTTTMSASPALGRFKHGAGGTNNVKVTLYQNGVKYKDGTWDDGTGTASFSALTGSETNLVVQVEGGEYFDEANNVHLPFVGKKMRAVIEKPYAAVAITPLTNAAARRLLDDDANGVPKIKAGKGSSDVLTENYKEAQRFGLANVLTPPVLVSDTAKVSSGDLVEAQKYALVLAAMAEAAKAVGTGKTPADMAEDFAKDLVDETLDGKEGPTAITGISYDLAALTTDFTTTSATAAASIQDTGYTSLASLAPTTVDTNVTTAEVQATVTAVTSAGDGLGQARTLFSTLRTGILPYLNPAETGYTQTQFAAVEANFAALQSTAVGASEQFRMIERATGLMIDLLQAGAAVTTETNYGGFAQAYSIPGQLSCFNDKANLALYPTGTQFAAGCRDMTKLPVANNPAVYDRIVYSIYTEKNGLVAGPTLNDTVPLKWTGRIDRYDAVTNQRVIKGVNPATPNQTADDPAARQNGTITATVNTTESMTGDFTTTGSTSFTLNPTTLALAGDLWPVLAGTDKATVAINLAASGSGSNNWNWTQNTSAFSGSLALKLDGSLIAKNGGVNVATLLFAPTAGTASNALSGSFSDSQNGTSETNSITSGLLDTKVTFATTEYEIAGAIKLTGISSKANPVQDCWYNYVGSGGNFNYDLSTNSFVSVSAGTGEFVVSGCHSEITALPTTFDFSGTVKNLATGTMIFEGKFNGSADYANYSPFLPLSATNYFTGTATISGTLKKTSTDPGIKLQVVATRSTASPETYVASYTDGNSGLGVQATWTAGATSGTITNNLSAGIKVVISDVETLVKSSTDTTLGKIVGGIVTYIDGYTESIL